MLEASSIVDVTIAISTLYCSVKKGLRAGDIFQILFLAPLARGKSGTAATSGESASGHLAEEAISRNRRFKVRLETFLFIILGPIGLESSVMFCV